jgi:hypothetical protein
MKRSLTLETNFNSREQGFLDGYEAALECAKSCRTLVTSEIDPIIAMGAKSVVSALERNLKIYKKQAEGYE